MQIEVFTLFPAMFDGYLQESILKRAQQAGLLTVRLHNIRDYATDKHHVTDDIPYGGGGGMVMKPDPVFEAVETALGTERNAGAALVKDFAAALLSGAPIEPIVSALTKPRLRDQAKAYLVDLVGPRLSAFSVYAQDPDAAIRRDIADVLGLAEDLAALSLAESLLTDRDQQVAKAAERAVARLRATTM